MFLQFAGGWGGAYRRVNSDDHTDDAWERPIQCVEQPTGQNGGWFVAIHSAHLEIGIKHWHCPCITKGQLHRNTCCLQCVTGSAHTGATAVK